MWFPETASDYKVEKNSFLWQHVDMILLQTFKVDKEVILMCAAYYSVLSILRKKLRKLLSTVKGIVFTVSVPEAQTELGRVAFMASALSLANSHFKSQKVQLSVLFYFSALF